MATKKQIAQVMKSAINEAMSYTLNMKPPTLEAKRNAFFKQLETIEPIPIQIAKAIRATQSGDGSTQATPKRKRIKHIPYKQALEILKRLNCPKDRKTLLRWMKGENTPDNFTPEKMLTVEAFLSWATIYAHREQAKIDTNNALRINNPNSRKMQKFR